MIKDFIKENTFIVVSLASAIFFVLFLIIDLSFGKQIKLQGTIIEKHFTPGTSSSGVGTIVNSDGQFSTMSTYSQTTDRFNLLVEANNTIYVVEVPSSLYAITNCNQKTNLVIYRGLFTKANYTISISKP